MNAHHLRISTFGASGIVTCCGLRPGVNKAIRGSVMELVIHVEVQRIHGFRNGYQGFVAQRVAERRDRAPPAFA